ncbi:hypothetical protein [Jidongwangia harbinensis]|uniref:hypothetical protein n=1 Tax=Jidongwangia harbinensis TaxID=2878561 RepID=UPI001CD9ECF7|nr:hypothetical protein [Jidongwangia harbinensis]MCA2212810.1 hypothetical protein [Jidongwangia harbinensis]
MNKEDLDTLHEVLDSFGPGLKYSVMDLARSADAGSGGTNIFYMESGKMMVSDSSQHISGDATVGAVVGGSANVSGGNFQGSGIQQTSQEWDRLITTIDLSRLSEELDKLRGNMRTTATEPAHDVAIAEVAQAQIAAAAGDRDSVRDHLAKAGKWALAAATAVGTTLAAAAIKAATGL